MKHIFPIGAFLVFSFFKIAASYSAEAIPSESFEAKVARGDAAAQHDMALMCPRKLVQGFANLPDYNCIVPWLEKSAAQGYPDAQLRLGALYANGDGVKKDLAKAQELGTLALEGFKKRAHEGDAYSMRQLSMLSADPVEKVKWLERSAHGGEVRSMMDIAKLYADGNGVDKNFTTVDSWVRKIAERKERVREFKVDIFGLYYSHPEDETNRINAYIWASQLPNHFLESASSKLTSSEIEKAKEHIRATTFPERISKPE